MSAVYLARGTSKVVRRITSETSVELKILTEKWQLLLAGLVFQYIHGLAARGVHYLHRPGPTLQDLGFMILPEFGKERGYISETLFTFIFLSFVLKLEKKYSPQDREIVRQQVPNPKASKLLSNPLMMQGMEVVVDPHIMCRSKKSSHRTMPQSRCAVLVATRAEEAAVKTLMASALV